jgi:hypothetical protein
MNFSGLNALGPAGGAKLLSENELMVIIKLLDTLPPGATLQSVITTNTTHPVVPILLALNPNQLQQIQQYMAARMRQLSQQFLQPQILQQVQMQQNVQPKQSVLVPPKPNVWHNSYLPDWICGANNCRVMNVGWRAACCECGAVKPGTGDNFMPRLGYHHNAQHTFNNNNAYDPHNNQQPYQQPPEFNGHDYSNQEPLPSYDNTQPSDDYPLEPLGVDVDAPVEEDPNDTEVETFDNATSSIISPVKQRPPPRVVSARANALIPPSIPAQNHQPSYHHEPSPPPIELEPEQGQTVKQRKTGDEMFKEALLHAQSREDINDYGLVGFLRYDDAAVSKTTDEAKNKVSIYKCVLVNVNKTRGSNYIPGLKKASN